MWGETASLDSSREWALPSKQRERAIDKGRDGKGFVCVRGGVGGGGFKEGGGGARGKGEAVVFLSKGDPMGATYGRVKTVAFPVRVDYDEESVFGLRQVFWFLL